MANRFVVPILTIGLALVAGTAGAGNPYAWGACCFDTWSAVFAGTRANSMGQADIAGARGPDALFLNAAPLAGAEDVAVSWDRWGSGTDEVENLALAVAFGALRLGVCRSADHAEFGYLDPADYGLPPGTPLIADRRTMYYGLGLDLGASLFEFENLRWMVGGVARRFEQEFQGSSYDRSGYDLGTSLERNWQSNRDAFRLAVAFTIQNVADFRDGTYPSQSRLGATFDWSMKLADGSREVFGLAPALAISWDSNPEEKTDLGLEVRGYGLVAARIGSIEGFRDRESTYGFGLILAEPFLGPVEFAVDWGSFEDFDMWGLRGNVRFD